LIIVTSYKLKYNSTTRIFTVIVSNAEAQRRCPYCRCAVKYRDSIVRKSKNITGKVFLYLLRRFICQHCEKLHREIPDVIHPYKHYDTDTIQSVLDESEEAKACVVDDSTIRRWKNEFTEKEPEINQELASIRTRETDEKVPLILAEQLLTRIRSRHKHWLRFVTALLINNGCKICTRIACPAKALADTINSAGEKAEDGGSRDDQTTEDSS